MNSKIFLLLILLILILCKPLPLNCQEKSLDTPLNPAEKIQSIQFGIFSGLVMELFPSGVFSELPMTTSRYVQKSLMNGYDALGYGRTYGTGIYGKYTLEPNVLLGLNISYTGWKGSYHCYCGTEDFGINTNSMSLLQFSIVPQYFFWKDFYVTAEISFNVFGAKASENSKRGVLDFSKNYFRIGTGLSAGYEYHILRQFSLDAFLKGHLTNLILRQEKSNPDTDSESLINQNDDPKESLLFFYSLNIGLLYHL